MDRSPPRPTWTAARTLVPGGVSSDQRRTHLRGRTHRVQASFSLLTMTGTARWWLLGLARWQIRRSLIDIVHAGPTRSRVVRETYGANKIGDRRISHPTTAKSRPGTGALVSSSLISCACVHPHSTAFESALMQVRDAGGAWWARVPSPENRKVSRFDRRNRPQLRQVGEAHPL
jgi:hypothetical protein